MTDKEVVEAILQKTDIHFGAVLTTDTQWIELSDPPIYFEFDIDGGFRDIGVWQ